MVLILFFDLADFKFLLLICTIRKLILPFLILPFAFHSFKNWKETWFNNLMILFVALNIIGNTNSLINYFSHKEMYDLGYSFSKVIPTPFKNDHIRYSIAVVISIVFCVEFFQRQKNKWLKIIFIIVALYDILFLHILSAKTGLLAFYLIAFIFMIKHILQFSVILIKTLFHQHIILIF